MSSPTPTTPDFHTLTPSEACRQLETTDGGLAPVDAEHRLVEHGPNVVPRPSPPPLWTIVLSQLRNPVIGILVIAAVLSLAIGHLTDAAFIAAVVALNTLIGAFEEHRAERSARSLQQLLRTRASVVRGGDIREIDAEGVVPGDVVWLEPGNRVPADVRLLATHGLQVDESLLTGESMPVLKDASSLLPAPTPVADRRNMSFAGSMVLRGRAKGLVVATAGWTQVGALALEMMEVPAGRAPLLVRLARFTRVVGVVVVLAALVVGVLGVTLADFTVTDMFLFAVALAVSAIPEGLPVAITVALAVAASRMARRGVIVRKLGAVEGLGSCTMIASDKTGTLTCNELTVQRVRLADGGELTVEGEGFAPRGRAVLEDRVVERGDTPELDRLMMAAVLCNEADLYLRDDDWGWRGDPTDVALLSMAHKLGWVRQTTLDEHPQVNQIAFEPEHRFAASYHRVDGEVRVFVKGGPERVLGMCVARTGVDWLGRRQAEADALATRGYRVLAIAEGSAPPDLDPTAVPPAPTALQLLGFVGMIDPLRPDVVDAIRTCRGAGIGVCMVTGDHPVTALAIARELGLADTSTHVVTGEDLAGLGPGELRDCVDEVRVFARVAPGQKLEIVDAAQRAGHFVAVTGDGVNDAPALRAANIGVAMGRGGTDVAREASDLVISDDHFATIVAGVEEGRVAYDNIRKVVYLLVSTGAAEVVLVTLAVATGSPLPLLPAQLLWLNLVTNGIQDVALAFERGEGDELRRPPRPPHERIFNPVMVANTAIAAIFMGVVGFAAFRWMLHAGWSEASARNGLLLLMVLFENVQIGNCRSETRSAFGLSPLRSPLLLCGAIAAFTVHVVAMHLELGQRVLGTEPVTAKTWLVLAAIASSLLVVTECSKLIRRLGVRHVTRKAPSRR